MRRHCLVISCLIIIGSVVLSNGVNIFSPIRELGPSLAASVAGGTIIAARSPLRPSLPTKNDGQHVESEVDYNNDECLVVLFRSPIASKSDFATKQSCHDGDNLTISSVFGHDQADGDNHAAINNSNHQDSSSDYRGLSFLPNGPINFPFLPSNNNLRILHAPSGLLLAATGFAPDADHILNVAAGRVFSRISVFDEGDRSVDPHRLVREDLSQMMMDAAMANGGRPLGVQLMVVGRSALLSNRRRANDCRPTLEVYTIDPSGGWRSCVSQRGTAVGRGAEKVSSSLTHSTRRNSLEKDALLESKSNPSYGWRGALERAMMASIESLEENDDPRNDAVDEQRKKELNHTNCHGAVVIFANSCRLNSKSKCATIHSVIVEECYDLCLQELRNKEKLPL